jgi:DNA repair exonuclease SbcCD ATPase subunit
MTEREIYLKIKEAITAVELYQKNLNEGKKGIWEKEINEGLESLTEKRHMLASSGDVCPSCGGSGRA